MVCARGIKIRFRNHCFVTCPENVRTFNGHPLPMTYCFTKKKPARPVSTVEIYDRINNLVAAILYSQKKKKNFTHDQTLMGKCRKLIIYIFQTIIMHR